MNSLKQTKPIMTKNIQLILEQIRLLQDNDKMELVSCLINKDLKNRFQKIRIDNRVLYIIDSKLFVSQKAKPENTQRKALANALSKIRQYNTYQSITDPAMWQKQIRDDR